MIHQSLDHGVSNCLHISHLKNETSHWNHRPDKIESNPKFCPQIWSRPAKYWQDKVALQPHDQYIEPTEKENKFRIKNWNHWDMKEDRRKDAYQ